MKQLECKSCILHKFRVCNRPFLRGNVSFSFCDQELKNSELGFGTASPEFSVSILETGVLEKVYTLLKVFVLNFKLLGILSY